jgi:hypothetical protein
MKEFQRSSLRRTDSGTTDFIIACKSRMRTYTQREAYEHQPDDGEVHGSLNFCVSNHLKAFALISNKSTGRLYSARLDCDLRSGEPVSNTNVHPNGLPGPVLLYTFCCDSGYPTNH